MSATLLVEGGFWLFAVVIYARSTHSRNRIGAFAFWVVVDLLTLSWHANITAGIDPNPVKAGIAGLIFFLLMIGWAYWMDRARSFER